MSFEPNYFDDPEPWTRIGFGGVLLTKVALTKINGVSTKHEWKKAKSKEASGSVNTFAGSDWSKPKLTFRGTTAEDFRELRTLWEMLRPVPGQGGTGSTGTPSPKLATGFAIGSAANTSGGAAAAPAATGTGSTIPDPGAKPATAASSSSTPNPGPRPPTISVQYPLLAWHEIFACALEEWDGPYIQDDLSMEATLTLVVDKPPTPAGTGAMAPAKPGAQFAIGSAAGPASGAPDPVAKGAAAGAGGV